MKLFTTMICAGLLMTAAAFGANYKEKTGMSDEKMVAEKVKVAITTNKGEITLELFTAEAPKTVENFLAYIDSGLYNGTVFHRVIDGFMIQGGGFTPDMKQKPTKDPVENEAGNEVDNARGTVAMARTMEVNSATSQFFINLSDNQFLNHRNDTPSGFGYCVFGKVTGGMDVVDAIAKVKTGSKGHFQDVPQEDVVIESVAVVE